MYVDTSTVTTKYGTYTRHLLRESYREEGKIKKRLIANISDCKEEEIRAIKLALSYTRAGTQKRPLIGTQKRPVKSS